jgi:hypothetical protein
VSLAASEKELLPGKQKQKYKNLKTTRITKKLE